MEFRYTRAVTVRFRDLDPMSHVNNAIYATYLEEARAGYYAEVIGEPLPEADTVLAHLEVDFRRPIELGEEVEVGLRVPRLGGSSIPMEYRIRADGEVAATAETVQVVFDRGTGESRPVPEEWRRRIEEFEGGL